MPKQENHPSSKDKSSAIEQQLRATIQQLRTNEQQLKAANQQLRANEQQFKAANQQLDASNQQLRASEEELRKVNHNLQERVKELTCLYGFSNLVEQTETLEEIIRGLVELISPGWQYPEITAARIIFEGCRFKTDNFQKTAWMQSTNIKVHGRKAGTIEVCYLRKRPVIDEGPFLKEERKLLDVLAERLGRIIERKRAEEDLRKHREHLEELAEERTAELREEVIGRKKAEEELRAANQQLRASEQQLKAANQQLRADEQQLKASNQQLHASEQQLRAANQQLQASEQQLRAANQQLQAEVTERKKVEGKIKASLREKEVLLKEIHHRVKNNMQVISSILNLQSRQIKNKHALKMFEDSQNRIKSMALVHEKLYESENLARIDFAEYTRSMTNYLFSLYRIGPAIGLNIDIKDSLLDVNTAIPCGLIINELISNSLKYAFPEGIEGEICIQLYSDKDGKFTLIVEDNGIGFPKDLDFRKTESLGMQLIIMLVEQLEGTIELDKTKGTSFTITFEKSKT